MASKKAYVDHLRSVPLFASCTRKELELIARSGDEITMTAGTMLVDQGQTGHEAFVVVDGKVAVKRNGRKVATLGQGAIVGELSLLDHGPRTARGRVRDRLHAVRHVAAPLPRRLDDVPSLSHKLLAALAEPHPRPRPRRTTARAVSPRPRSAASSGGACRGTPLRSS